MKFLREGAFWGGFALGYLFLVVFPQFNIRSMGSKGA